MFLCWGCGYRSTTSTGSDTVAVSIPLIANDEDGVLRNELAKAIASTGKYRYTSSQDSRYQLIVSIKGDRAEHIGYVWDEEPITGEILNRLYPSEGRRAISVSVSIKDTDTNKTIVGPFVVNEYVDFDFVNPTALKNIEFTDVAGQSQSVLQFSLGQLDSEEGAKNESYHPAFKELSQKIASVLLRIEPKKS